MVNNKGEAVNREATAGTVSHRREEVGRRIRAARQRAGKSAQDVIDALVGKGYEESFTRGAVSKIEQGITKKPAIHFLVTLCELCDASPLWVLFDVGPKGLDDARKFWAARDRLRLEVIGDLEDTLLRLRREALSPPAVEGETTESVVALDHDTDVEETLNG